MQEKRLTSGLLYGLWYYGILGVLSFLVWFVSMDMREVGGMTLFFFIITGIPIQFGVFASVFTLALRFIPLPGWCWKMIIPLLHFMIYIFLAALSEGVSLPDVVAHHFGSIANPVALVFFFSVIPLYFLLWLTGKVRKHLQIITAGSRKGSS